jgi:hypothetical protein
VSTNWRGGSADHVLLAEALTTIAAALDIAVAASSPSVATDEVLRLRRAGRAQLDVAARLLFTVRHHRAKLDQPAAAGAGPPGRSRPQRPSSFPGGDVAINSDTPIESTGIPGWTATGIYDSGAQGSGTSMRPESSELGQAPVNADPFQSAQGPRPMTAQGSSSTVADANPMRDTISGQDQSPHWQGGHIAGPRHPNAESGGGR